MEACNLSNILTMKQEVASAFTIIFGKEADKLLDEGMIKMVDIVFHPQEPKFNYVKALSIRIKAQLEMFKDTRVFRYNSYLIYLLLFHHPK